MAEKLFFCDFRVLVQQHYHALAAQAPEAHSTHWFLLRYVRRIVRSCEQPAAPWRVESAIKSMLRFYVDNIDEQSEQGERCRQVYQAYKKTVRQSQEAEY